MLSTSTGASLVTWALARPPGKARPGIGFPVAELWGTGSRELSAHRPLGERLARLLIGERGGFEPISPLNAHNWTTDYPVRALVPMAQSVRLANHTCVEDIKVPALFLQSAEDKVVRPDRTAAVAARWGGPHALIDPGPTATPTTT